MSWGEVYVSHSLAVFNVPESLPLMVPQQNRLLEDRHRLHLQEVRWWRQFFPEFLLRFCRG